MSRFLPVTLTLSLLVGVLSGLTVAGFDELMTLSLNMILDQRLAVVMVVPPLGLCLVALISHLRRDDDTATTDAYVRAYHQRGGRMSIAAAWPRVLGSAITLGTGNAFGFEGPSILIGGTIGSTLDERFGLRLRRDDAKILMVAGAAAGVAAVFKAPLTGVVFALEVPYRSDLARRALLPSLVAAGSAYVTFVTLMGTAPLLPTGGSAPFDLRDLGGGLILGLACGVLARLGARAMELAKSLPLPRVGRVLIGTCVLVAIAPLGQWWFGGPFHLGPSYEAIEWAISPGRSAGVLAGLFVVRAIATWCGVAAGGMGGLFIPLVTQGAIIGALVQQFVNVPNAYLFPTIGIAAMLGAGYRTPLAGVAFVAEATGQPGFLIPAFIAAAASQFTMGTRSFSPYQRSERSPEIGPLTRLAVSEIMSPNADTVAGDMPLDQALTAMMRQNRRWAPVVVEGTYVGLIAVTDIAAVTTSDWPALNVVDVARNDVAAVSPDTTLTTAAKRMRSQGTGALAVTENGRVIGVVTERDLSNVEVLLDHLANPTD
ncbi:MAG: chloride channel protein [Microthrixaceae bacterium]